MSSILRMLNSDTVLGWHRELGRPFTRSDVVQALSRLIRDDLVRALVLNESGKELEPIGQKMLPARGFDDAYFELTRRGRMIHHNWEPETISPDSA